MNREAREEVLARLLARALELLGGVADHLSDTDEAKVVAGDVADFTDDCRDFMAGLVQTQWPAGEAPPGVEALQAEVKSAQAGVVAEERRANRNKRKAVGKSAKRRN